MPHQWWTSDAYLGTVPVPDGITQAAGPEGVALVRAWKNGKTDPGWGLRREEDPENSGFMWKYEGHQFLDFPILHGFNQGRWNFAFVMRSLKLVCIDIDGKNGGDLGIGKLGALPYTLAETSKSGNGYHLFYATSEDEWDKELGFAQFPDRINVEQGVDIRATGCVFHHPQQRWNEREISELPLHLKKRLTDHSQKAAAQLSAIAKTIQGQDDMEVLIMQDALLDDLKKPIPTGRRNTTLFAIGQQLKVAQVPNWEKHVSDRATSVGLDVDETAKLIANIKKYGA